MVMAVLATSGALPRKGARSIQRPTRRRPVRFPTAAQEKASDKGYEINFENTPVATVAKAILGDILGVGYTIDPRVQGTVSLSSGRAVPQKRPAVCPGECAAHERCCARA